MMTTAVKNKRLDKIERLLEKREALKRKQAEPELSELDKLDVEIEQARDEQRSEEIALYRDDIAQVAKRLDGEAVRLLKQAYKLHEEILELEREAVRVRQLANKYPDDLTYMSVRLPANLISNIGSQLRMAIDTIEIAYPDYQKRSGYPSKRRGYKW